MACQCGCVDRRKRRRAALAFDCGWKMTKADYARIIGSMATVVAAPPQTPITNSTVRHRLSSAARRDLELRVLAFIAQRRGVDAWDVADAFDLNITHARGVLWALQSAGRITRLGPKHASRYVEPPVVVPFQAVG
jgi:hypothetical protein